MSSALRSAFVVTVAAGAAFGFAACESTPPAKDPPIGTSSATTTAAPTTESPGPTTATPDPTADPDTTPDGVVTGKKCDASVDEGKPCAPAQAMCDVRKGCGPNGWRCENGKWHRMFTYCNPPPPK